MQNPYLAEVSRTGRGKINRARVMLEPIVSEHMQGWGAALEGRAAKNPIERVKAHQVLRIGMAAANQAKAVAYEVMAMTNPILAMAGVGAFEAALSASTLTAAVTSFVTQAIHTSLDVWPRLLAPRVVSMQPFTQPSGYVFALKRVTKPGGRDLSALSTFDETYGDLTVEGEQLEAVGIELTKTLVEVHYKGLMHQHSHQLDVALRSQYGLSMESLGDAITFDELAWEVDREVINALVVYAGTNPRGDVYWDPTAGGLYATYAPSEQHAWDKTFISTAITSTTVDMANDIYRAPTFYIAGANVMKLLFRTPDYMAERIAGEEIDLALISGSIISSRLKTGETVLFDPQMDPDTMLAGYTNNMNPFWAGYVFSPFGLASILTAAFMDPDNLMRKKARALAFAKVGINAKQYRLIRLGTPS